MILSLFLAMQDVDMRDVRPMVAGETAGWTELFDSHGCAIAKAVGAGDRITNVLLISRANGGLGISMTNEAWTVPEAGFDLVLDIDGTETGARAVATSAHGFIAPISDRTLRQIADGEVLRATGEGVPVEIVPLDGTHDAVARLHQCAAWVEREVNAANAHDAQVPQNPFAPR